MAGQSRRCRRNREGWTRPMYSIGIAVAQSGRWLCVRHGDTKTSSSPILVSSFLQSRTPSSHSAARAFPCDAFFVRCKNRGGVVLRLRSWSNIPVVGPRPATSASSQGPGKSEVTPSASTNKATLSCQRGRPKPHVREAQGI